MSAVPQSPIATSLDRRIRMLRTAMGPVITAALEDPDVVEIMLNPDRSLWVDRLSSGRAPLGVALSEEDGERIIRLVAAHVEQIVGDLKRQAERLAVPLQGGGLRLVSPGDLRAQGERHENHRPGHAAMDRF